MSARPSTSSPDRASGATYLSVPTKNPVRVRRSSGGSSASRAMPKSSSLARWESGSRSEEHTSELQSPCNLVCRLLLEKKKKTVSEKELRCRTCNTASPVHLYNVSLD